MSTVICTVQLAKQTSATRKKDTTKSNQLRLYASLKSEISVGHLHRGCTCDTDDIVVCFRQDIGDIDSIRQAPPTRVPTPANHSCQNVTCKTTCSSFTEGQSWWHQNNGARDVKRQYHNYCSAPVDLSLKLPVLIYKAHI